MTDAQISLNDQIGQFLQQRAGDIPKEQLEQRRAERAVVLRAGGIGTSLKAGDSAPDFTLPDAYGAEVTLSSLLKTGPVVLTFYRGDWCPFCNFTLLAYQSILPEITAHHGTLVAVSPQNPDLTLLTVEHRTLTYPVLSDVGNHVARQYTLLWSVPEAQRPPNMFHDENDWLLPAPGTFVIGRDRQITLAYIDADYTRRMEPSDILAALRQLAPSS